MFLVKKVFGWISGYWVGAKNALFADLLLYRSVNGRRYLKKKIKSGVCLTSDIS